MHVFTCMSACVYYECMCVWVYVSESPPEPPGRTGLFGGLRVYKCMHIYGCVCVCVCMSLRV